jgi:hypothetical protein
MKLRIVNNQGIHITRGDLTFSIQIGKYNYCSNRLSIKYFNGLRPLKKRYDNEEECIKSYDCEVAVMHKTRGWITNLVFPENRDHAEEAYPVIGYVPIEKALEKALNWEE